MTSAVCLVSANCLLFAVLWDIASLIKYKDKDFEAFAADTAGPDNIDDNGDVVQWNKRRQERQVFNADATGSDNIDEDGDIAGVPVDKTAGASIK